MLSNFFIFHNIFIIIIAIILQKLRINIVLKLQKNITHGLINFNKIIYFLLERNSKKQNRIKHIFIVSINTKISIKSVRENYNESNLKLVLSIIKIEQFLLGANESNLLSSATQVSWHIIDSLTTTTTTNRFSLFLASIFSEGFILLLHINSSSFKNNIYSKFFDEIPINILLCSVIFLNESLQIFHGL